MIHISGATDTGCVRKNNEDRFLIDESAGLCVLADGMGGHGHGEVAAELAVRASHQFLQASKEHFDMTWPFGYDYQRSLDENRLVNAVQLANRQVWKSVQARPELAGMGATVVALALRDGQSTIGSVGDSRAYLLRDGQMKQLTVDDSWVNNLVISGALTEEDARRHAMRNVLTQAVGTHKELDVHTCQQMLFDGDVLLLTSDGIHGVVEPAIVRSILFTYPDVQHAAHQLVRAARDQGAPDNATCIVVRYRGEGPA